MSCSKALICSEFEVLCRSWKINSHTRHFAADNAQPLFYEQLAQTRQPLKFFWSIRSPSSEQWIINVFMSIAGKTG
jgi:hypothetical protein